MAVGISANGYRLKVCLVAPSYSGGAWKVPVGRENPPNGKGIWAWWAEFHVASEKMKPEERVQVDSWAGGYR